MTIEQKIRDFVLENYLFTGDQSALANDDSFLEKGILDSTGVLEIVGFLEDKFNLAIEDDELVPENFDSVNKIARFVSAKQSIGKTIQPITSTADHVAGNGSGPICDPA